VAIFDEYSLIHALDSRLSAKVAYLTMTRATEKAPDVSFQHPQHKLDRGKGPDQPVGRRLSLISQCLFFASLLAFAVRSKKVVKASSVPVAAI